MALHRLPVQEVGHLHLELQFCPFVAAGERAEADSGKPKPAGEKSMIRRMTRSNVSNDHKGVLTVNVISAANLTVSADNHLPCCMSCELELSLHGLQQLRDFSSCVTDEA